VFTMLGGIVLSGFFYLFYRKNLKIKYDGETEILKYVLQTVLLRVKSHLSL